LASVGPLLTAREAEVCACIVHGMSSEGIALELGISVNTVRTFRKRAYSRLNICSQNELMKVVLAGLAKAHPMPVAAPSKAPAR
jgi:DNA-binding CsgD family transcriptional regulator